MPVEPPQPEPAARPFSRVVLVGLPGAGKSTVAHVLAERLGWRAVDLDDEIVRRTGRTVADLFERDGESAFRAMESRLTAELSSQSQLVLAPGGGWAARPGSLEALPPGTATVWLRVSPEEAIRRLRGSPVRRPLLGDADPLAALRRLAQHRNERYALANVTIDVDDRSADETATLIGEWLKRSTS
jgi:shikimate kinase